MASVRSAPTIDHSRCEAAIGLETSEGMNGWIGVDRSESDGFKSFQALEMKTENIRIKGEETALLPAHYLHADFDLTANFSGECPKHINEGIERIRTPVSQ